MRDMKKLKTITVCKDTYTIQPEDAQILVEQTEKTPVALIISEPRVSGLIITDTGGNASTNNITIVSAGDRLICGAESFIINTDYGRLTLYKEPDGNYITSDGNYITKDIFLYPKKDHKEWLESHAADSAKKRWINILKPVQKILTDMGKLTFAHEIETIIEDIEDSKKEKC